MLVLSIDNLISGLLCSVKLKKMMSKAKNDVFIKMIFKTAYSKD
jgi:hypothetical protein